jgi:hypothetical protein
VFRKVDRAVREFGGSLRMAARNREQQKKYQKKSATENPFSFCGATVRAKILTRCSVAKSG